MNMLSKSQLSFVKSLHQKKFRKEHALFIAEGYKLVSKFILSGYQVHTVYSTADNMPKMAKLSQNINLIETSPAELNKISTLQNPQGVLAIIKTREQPVYKPQNFKDCFTLVLDGVQDPGNMGTIIRTADWFGIKQILCSEDTVEVYNPKVVQATMGSLARVNVTYASLPGILKEAGVPVYGALLSGTSVYEEQFGTEGIIVLGNEGNGISQEVQERVTKALTIPGFGGAESLNVAISAALFCYEIKRHS